MTGGTFPSSSPSIINGQLHTNNGMNHSCEMTPITHNNLSPSGTAPIYTTPMSLAEPERMNSFHSINSIHSSGSRHGMHKLNNPKKSCDTNDSMYQECKIQDNGNEWNIDTPQGPQSSETMHLVSQTLRNSPSQQALPQLYRHYTPGHPHHGHGFPNTNTNHTHSYSPVQWGHGHGGHVGHYNNQQYQYAHPNNPWHRMHAHSVHTNSHTHTHHGHIQLSQVSQVSDTPTPDGKKRNINMNGNTNEQSKSSGNSNGYPQTPHQYSPSGVDYNSPLNGNGNGGPLEFRKQASISSVYGPGFPHSRPQNQPQQQPRAQRRSEPPPPPPGPHPSYYQPSANTNNIGSPNQMLNRNSNRNRNRNQSMPPAILLNNTDAKPIDENKEDGDMKENKSKKDSFSIQIQFQWQMNH